jgi:hypothetical protein
MRSSRLIAAFLAFLLATTSACRGSTAPDPLVGTWLATTFRMTSAGQGEKDVLAAGGTLGLNIASVDSTFITTGTVILPASVTGSAPFNASLAGPAVRANSMVRFVPVADSFMRDLVFTLVENRLEAVNQIVAGTSYNIILTRQ